MAAKLNRQEGKIPGGEITFSAEGLLQLLESASQGIIYQSADGTIATANQTTARMLGLPLEELIGRKMTDPMWEMVREDGSLLLDEQHPFALALRTGKTVLDTILGIRHPGKQRIFWVKVSAAPEFSPGQEKPDRVCTIFLDINEQKQVEHKLNELQAFYSLSEVAGLEDISLDSLYPRILDFLPESWQYPEITCARITQEGKEFKTQNHSDTPWKQAAAIGLNGRTIGSIEIGYLAERPTEDEGPFLKQERRLLDSIAERIGRIIERKQRAEILQKENSFIELAMQASKLGKWQQNFQTQQFFLDATACRHFGSAAGEIAAQDIFDRIHPDDVGWIRKEYQTFLEQGSAGPRRLEYRILHPDGTLKWLAVDVIVQFIETDTGRVPVTAVGTSQDITAQKLAEDALQQKTRSLATLSACNQALVKVHDEMELLHEICRICVDEGNYCMAWVGYPEQEPEKAIRAVAHYGFDEGYLESAAITWADTERGRGPTGTAVRTQRVSLTQNIQQDPSLAPWREAAAQRGFSSSIALPLNGGGNNIGVFSLYSREPDAFKPEEVDLLIGLTNDLAYGIEALRSRANQKHLEEELIKSEGRYKRSQQSAHVGSWEWDVQTDILYGSDEMDILFERKPSEPAPSFRNAMDTVLVEDKARISKVLDESFATGMPFDMEFRILDSAGCIKWFNAKGNVTYNEAGEPVLASGTMQDVTRRKQAEEALQQRLLELETVDLLSKRLRAGNTVQELLQILLDETLNTIHTQDGCIFLFNRSTNKLDLCVSRGWFEQLDGLSLDPGEGIHGHVFTTNQRYIAAEVLSDPLVTPQVKELAPKNQSGGFFPIQSSEGTLGVMDVYIPLPRSFSENEQRLLTIISQLAGNATLRSSLHDRLRQTNLDLQNEIEQRTSVQEMLAAEKELLSTTLMSIAEGVIIVDKEGNVVLYNRAAEKLTGYQTQEVTGQPLSGVFQLIDPNTQQVISDLIEHLYDLARIQEDDPNYKAPILITRSGGRILVSGSIALLKTPAGEIVGHVLVFQNITEKLKAEAQMLLSQKMEAIGQLAAGIAHEINTPIQYIGDNLRFLQKTVSRFTALLDAYQQATLEPGKVLSQEDVDHLNAVKKQQKIQHYLQESPLAVQEALDGVERVRKIVLAMREFSHPSEKEKKLSDINHGIETTIVISRNEWKYCAELDTDLDPELPLVNCQIDEVNQVILNMIINAAQSIQEKIPAGSGDKGKIFIQTRNAGSKVLLSIQDTGKGIPEDICMRIFEPFFTTKGVGKGTGQGLSMAHNIIVNKHQGRIMVASTVGQGTTFTIELPLDPATKE